MDPTDAHAAWQTLLDQVISRLDIPKTGDDLALRLGWQQDRGSNRGRRVREWVDRGQPAPRQFLDLLHMLDEAGLLQPEAVAAWRSLTLAEATRHVATQRTAIAATLAKRLGGSEPRPRDARRPA